MARPGTFQKGISGNPGGRPKGQTREMSAYAREFGVAGIAMLAEMAGLTPGKLAEPDAARVAAIRELLDRGFGKATQIIGGDEDRPVAIAFEWAPAQQPAVDTTVIDAEPDTVEIAWDTSE